MRPHPSFLAESLDARSKTITTADGLDTFGVLNRHAAGNLHYQVGLSENKGTRRSMEDAHSFVVDFGGIRGQGFFAVFDGHAGKHAAEWCGGHFHESLLEGLQTSPDHPVPDILNQTFHTVDDRLSRMSAESDGRIHSGCTAVTAFIRIEDTAGKQSFLFSEVESPASGLESHDSESGSGEDEDSGSGMIEESRKGKKSPTNGGRFKKALRSFGKRSPIPGRMTPRSRSPTVPTSQQHGNGITVFVPPTASRRVLYSANAGDARAVLCRAGKAIRLTYDHKGSDKQEAKRIMDAGGFVLGGRVNGVLAVTRSLGDSSMKDYVVGSPYTTETVLGEEDEFLILACDGLWDVTTDQAAINLIRDIDDAQAASQKLLSHALDSHTTDNVTVLVVRFKNDSEGSSNANA